LADHLRQVAEQAARFATPFGSAEWACAAGWLHDLGKAASAFQGYLLRANELDDSGYDSGRLNHSSAGAALAVETWHGTERGVQDVTGKTLACLAAGHHAGLPDYYTAATGNAALVARLEDGREQLHHLGAPASALVSQLPRTLCPPRFLKQDGFHLWVRMLFSCLVDADCLDTEAFMQPEQAPVRAGFAALAELKAAFDRHMTHLAESARSTSVNAIRRDILAACRAAALKAPGLFSLTVPTGGGKTLSSMAFALDHAVAHGKSRIIYVIPYTSIIEQTADTLRHIFGDSNVVEHHSNLDPDKETQRAGLAAENWDAPIIVTTNVQFFESLYAAKSGRCRKLHNLVNSVVILDEAQLLPPERLDPCVGALNQLTTCYGVTLVLSTATQPALPGLSRPPTEIMPDPAKLYAVLTRTDITFPADLNERVTWPGLAAELQQHAQVLCIVNSRRDCHDLFTLMPEGTIHLSALMCGAHRSRLIRYIKWRLKKRKPIRVITTQLIEAGVDIDFAVVYRALAGLDSIAQAAGRCNREGRLAGPGQVHVFVPPTDPPRGLLRKGADTTRELAACEFNPQSPADYTRYFSLFYARVNDTGGAWLRDRLVADVPHVQFRTAGDEFKLIDDQAQRPVIVLYRSSPKALERLRFAGGPVRDLMRQLQRYTVNLPTRLADAMLADGRLYEVVPGVIAQCSPGLYDPHIGLNIYRQALPVEDLIV
jgi:CRISPR-associated endonuclease/helicase Cas3